MFVVVMKANENPGSWLPVLPVLPKGQVGSGQVRSGPGFVFWGAPTAPNPGSRGVPWGFRLGLPVAGMGAAVHVRPPIWPAEPESDGV